MPRQRAIAGGSDGAALTASFMLAAAGLAHLAVTPAHFGEWWAFGVLFALAAGLQLGLAVLLVMRPSRGLLGAAVVLSVGIIATWVASRTSGLPFGPDAAEAEPVGVFDVLTTLEEAMLVVLAAFWEAGRWRRLVTACQGAGIGLALVLTLAFAGGVGHG